MKIYFKTEVTTPPFCECKGTQFLDDYNQKNEFNKEFAKITRVRPLILKNK